MVSLKFQDNVFMNNFSIILIPPPVQLEIYHTDCIKYISTTCLTPRVSKWNAQTSSERNNLELHWISDVLLKKGKLKVSF